MKRKFYKITVMCLLASAICMSGCEGLNPAADFMKAANEAKASENEKEIAEKEIAASVTIKQMEIDAEAARRRDELAAEKLKNKTDASGTIMPGTETESTSDVNASTDQSTVGSTTDNTDLAK